MVRETRKDRILSVVYDCLLKGKELPQWAEFLPYQRVKDQLNIDKECVLKANRVIVPVKLKDKVLQMLHSEHMGISKTKNLARYYVWWPKIDEDIECLVKSCEACQLNRNDPEKHSSHSRQYPSKPWERIHINFLEIAKCLLRCNIGGTLPIVCGSRKHILSLLMPICFLSTSVRTVCSCVSQRAWERTTVTLCLWPSEVVFLSSLSGLGERVALLFTVPVRCFCISFYLCFQCRRDCSFFLLPLMVPTLFIYRVFTNRTQPALKFNLTLVKNFLCL